MVVFELEMISPEEVESQLQAEQNLQRIHHLTSLGRQASIYSLTLDELQHTLCEGGKNFGSMNMDEFLTSIWTVEENQAINNAEITQININTTQPNQSLGEATSENHKAIARERSLSRQGSLTLPAPLCRKTVDEVWSEIHNKENEGPGEDSSGTGNVQNPETAQREPTFGEMTLEDFLVKAGVVTEQCPIPPPQQQSQHGIYQNSNGAPAVGPSFVSRPIVAVTAAGGGVVPYSGAMVEELGFGGKRTDGYPVGPPAGAGYGVRMGNGGGYGPPAQGIGTAAPLSPETPDGMCNQVDNMTSLFGMDMGGLRGRKRTADGPVEKVVERRQRRMIKNRESAARSRARKHAYTVELEAELNQLKEENAQLRQALYFEDLNSRAPTKAQKANEKLKTMRRNSSCPP
ncbi:protein ABSCISIC ACID-INSENSITIVE 5 [Tripterygium wilfordii]|uniref:Protein ABSCISIC ACID-INSENSITIVE 5 n=1 Tax=Tripterygium wilfordii TaxID=458696 RepID=A0A7J7DNF9_TRIWF|nr:protein ABSCISIC ACID-INSENSITIVE 5-like isoform X2 [Tripterygium wilfordii]XP_038701233.1 protein ABSCISIC ACID-INSENSITIVE 5-like isoform X2 [Tripterygium wilfordii]KAF5747809.1 protein ABSCISIC ACID-INSENSITIVE 5 [Tripterygium wilfordii]